MNEMGLNEERIGLLQEREKRYDYSSVAPISSHYVILNLDKEDELTCYGYANDRIKNAIFIIGSCVLLFVPFLIVKCYPHLNVYLRMRKVSLSMADCILIKDYNNDLYVSPIRAMLLEDTNLVKDHITLEEDQNILRYFRHQNVMFYYYHGSFHKLQGYEKDLKLKDFAKFTGYSSKQQEEKLKFFGPNLLEFRCPSTWRIFMVEVFTPFYLFQLFNVIMWLCSGFLLYTVFMVILMLFCIIVAVLETKNHHIKLQFLSSHVHTSEITVLRDNKDMETVHSSNLVPGDVVLMRNDTFVMCCDAVIIRGSCTVDESDLTGNSVPSVKTSVGWEDELYTPDTHPQNTVFCGTTVLQCKKNTVAVVVRTGFYTSQGDQLRLMKALKPYKSQFQEDCKKVVFWLFIIASLGFCFSCFFLTRNGVKEGDVLLYSLIIFTLVVPPTLPMVMTLTELFSQARLSRRGILTTTPSKTQVLGAADILCFDKTGTLTETTLSLHGVLPSTEGEFSEFSHDPLELEHHSSFLISLACCHNLTLMKDEVIGDPLDLIIFKTTKWMLTENFGSSIWETSVISPYSQRQINILKIFPFSSNLQRLTVIVMDQGMVRSFIKGAPEKLHSICDKKTIPASYYEILSYYTRKGCRVIAYAQNTLGADENKALTMKRSDIENGAEFLGFVCLINPVKHESKFVMKELKDAGLRCIMVTGDSVGTGISVARELEMIPNEERMIVITATLCKDTCVSRIVYSPVDPGQIIHNDTRCHLALNGDSWDVIYSYQPDLLKRIVLRGVVFGRMLPEQKEQLMNMLKEQKYIVAMCGDGSNDLKALEAADIGINVSKSKSFAGASFVSQDKSIACVPTIIKEGRCALMSIMGLIKFMVLYSIIRFCSLLFLYIFQCDLSVGQHLYIDILVITSMSTLMVYASPCDYLYRRPPLPTLLAWQPLISLFGQTQLAIVFQIITVFIVISKPWHDVDEPGNGISYLNPISSSLFILSAQQFVNMACLFSYGEPYREPAFINVPFVLAVIVLTIIHMGFLFGSTSIMKKMMHLIWPMDPGYQYILLGIISVNLLVSFAYEHFAVNVLGKKLDMNSAWRREPLHRQIDKEIHPSWPYEDSK